MQLFQNVNENDLTKINFHDALSVTTSKHIHSVMKEILRLCGILTDTEELEMTYDMDCSKDEELARQLAEEDASIGAYEPNHDIPIGPSIVAQATQATHSNNTHPVVSSRHQIQRPIRRRRRANGDATNNTNT